MYRTRLVLVIALLGVLTTVPAAQAATAAKTLRGTVGPGFTISMSKKAVRRGVFKITIRDRSPIHNFHLTGPGVNKSTGVGFVGTVTWVVKLKKGTYRFVCDPHAATMKGTLRVK